ncbi:MAG: aminotransferase class I/II-fold pyridoxal phosphate-dependent enzyme [Candidatus Latescibacterota bacterium]|nr:MAG: aminotransferase class I/II-fold pyridoxal phosphate-dependent enzyme [Candidatus Latescibacterota bacterium]
MISDGGNYKIDRHVSLNLNVRGMPESPTLTINEVSKQLEHEGKEVYRLGLGQSPFPVPREVVKALKLYAKEKDYLPVKGLRQLRGAVAKFHRDKDQVNAQPDGVLVGPGSKELMFLLQLVFYGEILVPTPCWVSYVPQAKMLGKQIRLIHTSYEDEWRVTPEVLLRQCECENDVYRPRVLVLNYPGNPEGGTYTPDELEALAEIAKRFELIVLSDEIYGQLHFKGEHVSIARFYPERTIISSGLSKWCGAGGWRLGTFTFPLDLEWLMNAMASAASETYTSVSAPIQYAAVRAFRGGITIERYLCHARRILSELGNWCHKRLTSAGIRIHAPEGAFYLFLDFSPLASRLADRGITNSEGLCERLLADTGVALLPGTAFERPGNELTARLAYVDFDGSTALAASEMVPLDEPLPQDFIHMWCHRVIAASDLIAEWTTDGGKEV